MAIVILGSEILAINRNIKNQNISFFVSCHQTKNIKNRSDEPFSTSEH